MVQDLTEEELIEGFCKATGGMARSVERWHERAVTGTSDDELAKALAFEMGIIGGSGSPGGLHIEYRGAGLCIWIHREIVNTHQTPPTLQGKATIAMARRIYGIEDPSNPQLSLF